MHERSTTRRSLTSILLSAAVLSSLLAVAAPSIVGAVGPCTPNESGSTTVFPAIDAARPVWQGLAVNNGCTLTLAATGSGAGITAVRNESVNFAGSSRPLTAAESQELYAWKIGGDAMTFQVSSAASMSFVTQITAAQVQGIWNNTITNWSALGGPDQAIIADCRIVGSGSQGDLVRLFAISTAAEAAACDSRLLTSADEAAAANTPFHIVYTSLANIGVAGTKELKLSGGAPLITGIGNASTFVTPSVATVQNGTYPAPRELFLVANKFTDVPAGTATDTTAYVKSYDFINYMASSAGQAKVASTGFVTVAPFVAIPDYDPNLDGVVSLPDLGQITGKWSQSNAVQGWVRADVNNDGTIALGDIGGVTGRWGGTGFVAP
jgi:ABC-type phosphate transport system substrate-binding protein